MWAKVKVELPNRPKGDLIEVHMVGLVENYSSIVAEITEEQFESINGDGSFGLSAVKVDKPPAPIEVEVEEPVKEGGGDK